MKYIILSFFAIIALQSKAQLRYAVESIPKELKVRAAATIRNESMHVEMRAENDVLLRVKKAITVHNKSGDYYAAVPIHYNKSVAIKSIKGTVYDEYGMPIHKITAKNFIDISAADGFSMFSDSRLKLYQYDAIQYPYTIEIAYEIQYKQNLVIPSWNPNYSPQLAIEHSEYTFAAAPTVEIRSHAQHISTDPKVEKNEKLTTYTWEVSNIPAIKEENYTRSFREQAVHVNIVPKKISYYGKTGAFDSWEDFGNWYYDNLLTGKQNLDETAKSKVLDLIKDCKHDREKAKRLYQYLQEKTRYVSIQIGIGGLEPFSARDVQKYGYGDCKALVNYMQNLLTFADIPSYYCIVEAGNKKESLKPNFANVQDGNHIILCIPFENDTTWLECTSQEMPFGFLGNFTDDRLVLACTPDGGKVLRTPTYSEKDNRQLRTAKLQLLDLSNLQGTMQTQFFGTQYDNHMDVFRANNAEKPKLLARHYDINNISFDNIDYVKIDQDSDPSITENLSISIGNIATKTNNRIQIPSSLFNSFGSIQRNENRQQPIYINRGFTDEDRVEITLPENVNKLMTPLKKEFSCEMGNYSFSAHIEDDKLITNRILTIKQGTYEPKLYNEFHEFLRMVSQTDKGRFTLEILQ
ncbi:DUF3857 domain-containing protein [Sphingobacterium griseoflavum]|uniref:DUF3857 domain-containing protein n=1 Tax=Sphingobacterium griseoflavum TaxID=1474952 RepID=A0ABQ3HTJ4_9SPHI|nr:DUF3857 domain-containing protein [Sphingobacterium griseoflavum]GHE23102.1 hypothetical protein GCM10017764_00700 [Sphingobacterium griseoflavum]